MKTALLGWIIACLLLLTVQTHAEVTLTLAHATVPGHTRDKAAHYFADTVKSMSGGRIVVEVAADTRFGNDAAMIDALLSGILDMTINSQGAASSAVPEYNAFGMPFLFSEATQAWRLLDGAPGRELARRSAAKGLVVLGFMDNGIRHFSNNIRPIVTPHDVKGLKIRIPPDPVTAEIVRSMGGYPQEIKMSEVYNALMQKVVDGQENPLYNIYARKFYEVQKYLSLTGHKYEMTPFLMGKSTWDKLSEDDRRIIQSAADKATRYQRTLSQQANDQARTDLKTKGMRINKVNSKAFIASTRKVYDKWLSGPTGDYVRMVLTAAREQNR